MPAAAEPTKSGVPVNGCWHASAISRPLSLNDTFILSLSVKKNTPLYKYIDLVFLVSAVHYIYRSNIKVDVAMRLISKAAIDRAVESRSH